MFCSVLSLYSFARARAFTHAMIFATTSRVTHLTIALVRNRLVFPHVHIHAHARTCICAQVKIPQHSRSDELTFSVRLRAAATPRISRKPKDIKTIASTDSPFTPFPVSSSCALTAGKTNGTNFGRDNSAHQTIGFPLANLDEMCPSPRKRCEKYSLRAIRFPDTSKVTGR